MKPFPLSRRNELAPSTPLGVRCREIVPDDLEVLATLLHEGFGRGLEVARHFLTTLSDRPVPTGYPRFGYLLENHGTVVGMLLTIFSTIGEGQSSFTRCNVIVWYVKPKFQVYAPLLVSRVLRDKSVTYINVTPAPHTRSILEAQGYQQYASGEFVAFPICKRQPKGTSIETVTSRSVAGNGVLPSELAALLAHKRYGCLSVICDVNGSRHPFMFTPCRRLKLLPCALLTYSQNLESFIHCAGSLGRYLAARGILVVILNANGPVPALVGLYRDGRPKYFRGPHPPSLSDLAYTERAMFGV